MPPEVYQPVHRGLLVAAFVLASVAAALAFTLHLRKVAGSRPIACAALLLAALALAVSRTVVLGARRDMDASLETDQLLSACDKELVRHEAYGEARASACLALCGAPFALILATYVAAQSLRRPAWLGLALIPWALLGAVGQLYSQPLPGRRLWPGRCELYRERDAILGADREKLRRECIALGDLLKDRRGLGYALGNESQATVLPELPELKRRCLADLLEWIRPSNPDEVSRAEILDSPFVSAEDAPAVTRFLDEFKPRKPWDIDGGDEDPSPAGDR